MGQPGRPRKPKTRGEKTIAFIERFCAVPEGKLVGQPIQLADFQKKFIIDVFDNPDGTHSAYLSIARKNAKSTLIAAIAIAFICGPLATQQNAQIIAAAQSREQAGIIFKQATKIINQSETLSREIRIIPSSKKLIGKAMNIEFQAIAKAAHTAMGLSPKVVIVDELGQVKGPQDDFIDALTTSQGAYGNDALFIGISTQAPTDADLFSLLLDAQDASPDPHVVSHVYAADADCDVLDEAQWKKANPAMGLFSSIDAIRKEAKKAKDMPATANSFRNLILNQRVDRNEPFVSRDLWKRNGEKPVSLDPSVPCYAGLDLSARTDLTAFVVIQWLSGKWNIHTRAWTPEQGITDRTKRDRTPYVTWADQGILQTTPGATVSYGHVVTDIQREFGHLNFERVSFDRWRIDQFSDECERYDVDLPLVACGQGYKDISPSIESFEDELLNGRVRHGNNPILTMAAFNVAVTTDPAGSRKFDKKKTTGRIDPIQACIMAFFRPDGEPTDKKKKKKVNVDEWINDPLRLF